MPASLKDLAGTLGTMPVRVRFAPSPTGMLHVGSLRDALFKFLFARHEGGQNILRIEDTDRTRYDPASEQEFIDTLHWVGIDFDEGPHVGGPHAPYRQSERKAAGIYDEWVQLLLESGAAYKSFESTEELEEMREYQQLNKLPTGYFGGKWRDATPQQVTEQEALGKPFVVRQRIPRNTTIVIEDLIRGRIEWDSNNVDDPVLVKADGMPTYHFASMVDDHLMGITHIMRGEEWISSAPKHAALFDAFGWNRPVFVHCPVIVGNDGKKLSKRHGATRVLDYMAQGYLPTALKNFIALIGWSPGEDREAMTEAELIAAFELRGLQPSPGKFDIDKLRWLNGHHIRLMETSELLDMVVRYIGDPYVRKYWTEYSDENPAPNKPPVDGVRTLALLDRLAGAAIRDHPYAMTAIGLLKERVQVLPDFGEGCAFLFLEDVEFDQKAVEKWFVQPHVGSLFEDLLTWLRSVSPSPVAAEDCESKLRSWAEVRGMEKLGSVVHPTRVALTGKTAGPGLFELMSALGPVRMIRRFERALAMQAPNAS